MFNVYIRFVALLEKSKSLLHFQVEDMRLIVHNLGKFLSHRDVKVRSIKFCFVASFCF